MMGRTRCIEAAIGSREGVCSGVPEVDLAVGGPAFQRLCAGTQRRDGRDQPEPLRRHGGANSGVELFSSWYTCLFHSCAWTFRYSVHLERQEQTAAKVSAR